MLEDAFQEFLLPLVVSCERNNLNKQKNLVSPIWLLQNIRLVLVAFNRTSCIFTTYLLVYQTLCESHSEGYWNSAFKQFLSFTDLSIFSWRNPFQLWSLEESFRNSCLCDIFSPLLIPILFYFALSQSECTHK